MQTFTPRIPTCDPGVQWPETLHPLLQRIYSSRIKQDVDEINLDISRLISPDRLKNSREAAHLLAEAINNHWRILVCGDFDADGATSTALAIRGLRSMGAANIDYLVPNRFEYGYGLSKELVHEALKFQPDLIVTVDNGISSHEGVAYAREKGVRVLVTDHHLPGDTLPDANIIVNPNQPDDNFPSKNLAGVGVMFYLLLALRKYLREQDYFSQKNIAEPNLAEFLDLVALGTVADVVPLDQNNRIMVRQGIHRIRMGKCIPGITALLRVSGRNPASLVASDLGFSVGPRLNAAGRLDDMSIGIECLLAEETSALQLATQLDSFNRERREIESEMKQQALILLESVHADSNIFGLAMFDEAWHQGVIGILASRIKEKIHRPVVIFAPGDDGQIKGSARSIPGIHIRDIFASIEAKSPGLLLKFGGHAMAAGLTIMQQDFDKFHEYFDQEVERQANPELLVQTTLTDGELNAEDFSLDTWQMLEQAGPWGQGFPEPVFNGTFSVINQRVLKDRHYKLMLQPSGSDNCYLDAIAFNQLEGNELPEQKQLPATIDLTYRLSLNEYNGQRNLQLMVDTIIA